MRNRTIIGTMTAAALMLAPVAAMAQRAPLPAPSEETGSELKGGGNSRMTMVLMVGVLVAAILALLLLIEEEKQDMPTSP